MTATLFSFSVLFDLAAGHAEVRGARNKGNPDAVALGDSAGGPCGKMLSNVPSTTNWNLASSNFGGPKGGEITPGQPWKMSIHFTAFHGGSHSAYLQCSNGQAPTTNDGPIALAKDSISDWKILRLNKAKTPTRKGVQLLICDTWISQRQQLANPTEDVVLWYDIPADFSCSGEAIISWVWTANQNSCIAHEYLSRCGQTEAEYPTSMFRGGGACDTMNDGNEVWHNCVDLTVAGGGGGAGAVNSRSRRDANSTDDEEPPEPSAPDANSTDDEDANSTDDEEPEPSAPAPAPSAPAKPRRSRGSRRRRGSKPRRSRGTKPRRSRGTKPRRSRGTKPRRSRGSPAPSAPGGCKDKHPGFCEANKAGYGTAFSGFCDALHDGICNKSCGKCGGR